MSPNGQKDGTPGEKPGEDKKDKVKKSAAKASRAANDAAAVMAAGAAVCSLVPVVGTGIAAILGVGSAAAWLVGDAYSGLSIDPKREDFKTISIFRPQETIIKSISRTRFVTRPSDINFELVIKNFSNNLINLSIALKYLRASIERSTGISSIIEQRIKGNPAEDLKIYKASQLEAIKQNIIISANLQNIILGLTPTINSEWHNVRSELVGMQGTKGLEATRETNSIFLDLWDNKILPNIDLQGLEDPNLVDINGFRAYISNQKLPSGFPETLLDQSWYESMGSMPPYLLSLLEPPNLLEKIF